MNNKHITDHNGYRTSAVSHTGHKLSIKQSIFIDKYIELGNARQAGIQAGYSEKFVDQTIQKLLQQTYIAEEISYRMEQKQKKSIATGQQVMEFFTKVMNGEVKDQFGLDSTLSDRLKAANELARRTIDIENKLNGKDDHNITITIERRK